MMGNMKKQLIENNTCNEKLLVKYNGLQCDTKNITLEFSLICHGKIVLGESTLSPL
jgi:hypothetical protein